VRRLRRLRRPDASGLTALGLHALQHRGQEACGIACLRRPAASTEAAHGPTSATPSPATWSSACPASHAIGHTRYSTAGGSLLRNVQPMFADLEAGGFALAHNGNLTNFLALRRSWSPKAPSSSRPSDSEVILHLIARSRKAQASSTASSTRCSQIEGGYALVA
jgi:amidophosphoribosyltransferase